VDGACQSRVYRSGRGGEYDNRVALSYLLQTDISTVLV
jgi:hypothetical protein